MKTCPFCAEDIQDAAIVCKHCGRDMIPGQSTTRAPAPTRTVILQPAWRPGVAAVLSFVFPGAGQMYKGQVGSGVVWFLVVVVGYVMFIVPGLILHLCCILAAASGTPPQIQIAVSEPASARDALNVRDASPGSANAGQPDLSRRFGRALAEVVHPVAAWKSGDPGARFLVVLVFGLLGAYLLDLVANAVRW